MERHAGRAAPRGVDPRAASAALAAGGIAPGAARDVAALFMAATLDGMEAAAPLPPGPKLFLANHQIALDLLYLAAWLNGPAREPARMVVWDGVASAHPGELVARLARLVATAGGDADWFAPLMLDTRDPASFAALAARLAEGGGAAPSLIVAAEGMRQHADGQPVRRVGTAFVDAALAAGMAVVPVRFAWALPEASLARRFAWPHALAPMRVFLGRAIEAEALTPLALGRRRDRLAGAIDALHRPAPAGHRERNADIAARVARLQAGFGISQTKALAIDLLLTAPAGSLGPEGEALARALVDPGAALWARGDALSDFALWLSDGQATAYPLLHDLYGEAIAPRRERAWS